MEAELTSPSTRTRGDGHRFFAVAVLVGALSVGSPVAEWVEHNVHGGSVGGCDGQKLADVNGDGLMDVVVAHDVNGGGASLHIHPGYDKATTQWPFVFCSAGGTVEGVGVADLDGDGALDMISAVQGGGMAIHWAPADKEDLLDPSKWETVDIPNSSGGFDVIVGQIDGKNGPDIIGGSAFPMVWYESPANPRDIGAWKAHEMYSQYSGKVRTFLFVDMNEDGFRDVLFTPGKIGTYWLENPGPGPAVYEHWTPHLVYEGNGSMCFGWPADLDGDGIRDFVSSSGGTPNLVFVKRMDAVENSWQAYPISPTPFADGAQDNIKAVQVGDYNNNGVLEVVVAGGGGNGLRALEFEGDPANSNYTIVDVIADRKGKSDYPHYYDVDGDGDEDILISYESRNLSWYENPLQSPSTQVSTHALRPVSGRGGHPPVVARLGMVHGTGSDPWRGGVALNGRNLPRPCATVPRSRILSAGIYLSRP
jgi:hypothetical protein